MLKKYKNLIFLFLLSVSIFISYFLIFNKNNEETVVDIITIAACPTFYYRLDNLKNNENYSIILTDSTAISLEMLGKRQVDYAVGGREIMPYEPNFNYEAIGEGFSFISNESLVIYDNDLLSYTLYTDLDLDLLRSNFGDLNYEIVDDVYDYLKDNNIIITSWENSDFNRARIVHLLKDDNLRNIKSRLPTVFCQKTCNYDIIDDIKNLMN